MNYNEIQALLEKLPDQQIMQYAQGGNPQVPQVLAQMEAMRRENLRKSQTLQKPGIGAAPGMAAGGMVRKFAKGGSTEDEEEEESPARRSYRKSQEAREEKLEKAKQNRGQAMQEPGGPAYAIGNFMKSGIDGLRNVGNAVAGSAPVQGIMSLGQQIGDNFNNMQAMRDTRAADMRANQALAQGPTPFQMGQEQAPAAPPQAPPAPPPALDAGQGGISALAPESAAPKAAPPAGAPAAQATPEVLAKVEQAKDAQLDKFAQIFAQMDEMRKSSQGPAPDAELERKRAFYRALSKFGAALATTGIWAQAGDVGLQTFRDEIEKSEAKQREFRKESLQIGLAGLEDKLKLLGYEDAKIKEMKAEAQQMFENDMKRKQVSLQEQQIKQQGEFQRGSLGIQREAARNRYGGSSQALTYEDALKVAEDAFAKDPRLAKKQTLEQYAMQLYKSDPSRSGILSAGGANIGAGSGDVIDFNALK